MADIFVSYSRKDLERSEAIAALLRREHYSVAIDRDFLLPGDAYRASIAEELRRAKVVIVLWSRNSVESEFVRDEASRAQRAVLLQLILDDLPDSDVPLGFGELQRLRCTWSEAGELAAEPKAVLFAALERHLPGVEPLDNALDELRREVDRRLGSECDVLERIGTGRMAVVFKAQHRVYGRVALKVTPLAGILLMPGFYAEFRGNIEVARKLSHPNISSVRDVRLLDTIACTVTDYVDGHSLAHTIATARSRLTLGCIKDIAENIAQALLAAHTQRIVHCRLSPSSILIERETDRALVSDFGIPNVSGSPEATAARALFLNVHYMSPEQCLGQPATPQSDQYALGVILYEMLTGKPPFMGNSPFLTMRGHCEEQPKSVMDLRPHCPPAVARSVMRMLSKQPKDRYFTTRLLLQEIQSWPLAESRRSDPVSPESALERSAKIALDSFNRCLNDPSFLTRFYERLQAHGRVAQKLGSMIFDSQVELIRPAIRHLLEYAQGRKEAQPEIERIGALHQGYALDLDVLHIFAETLINLAVETDADGDPSASAALRTAWRAALDEGLRHFAKAAVPESVPAPFSGVVANASTPDAAAGGGI